MAIKMLILGDFHMPDRASSIPDSILAKIRAEKFDLVLCTGDLEDEEALKILQSFGREVFVVRGNMDWLDLPHVRRVEREGLAFGLIHGHGIWPRGDVDQLARAAKSMNVDVLVSGHTHRLNISKVEVDDRSVLLIDPGSATGVWGGGPASLTPSFVVVELKQGRATIRAYELVAGQLRESVMTFEKNP